MRQVLVADMMAAGATAARAAEANQISGRTIRRWQNTPAFTAYLEEKVDLIDQQRLDQRYKEAFAVVDKVMRDSKNDFAKLQAAGLVINARERSRVKDQSITVTFANAPEPVLPESSDRRVRPVVEGTMMEDSEDEGE